MVLLSQTYGPVCMAILYRSPVQYCAQKMANTLNTNAFITCDHLHACSIIYTGRHERVPLDVLHLCPTTYHENKQ